MMMIFLKRSSSSFVKVYRKSKIKTFSPGALIRDVWEHFHNLLTQFVKEVVKEESGEDAMFVYAVRKQWCNMDVIIIIN